MSSLLLKMFILNNIYNRIKIAFKKLIIQDILISL